MNPQLLDEFLLKECGSKLRQELLDAIRKWKVLGTAPNRKYLLGRFNLIVDFESRTVTVEDDLVIETDGEHTVSIDEFLKRLENST